MKVILLTLSIIVAALVILYVFAGSRSTTVIIESDSDERSVQTGQPTRDQNLLNNPESLGDDLVVVYFSEEVKRVLALQTDGPVVGLTSTQLLRAFPQVGEGDFDGVETEQGVYRLRDETLEHESTEGNESLAPVTITQTGMETLLQNIADRTNKPIDTTKDIDWLIGFLQTEAGEFGV